MAWSPKDIEIFYELIKTSFSGVIDFTYRCDGPDFYIATGDDGPVYCIEVKANGHHKEYFINRYESILECLDKDVLGKNDILNSLYICFNDCFL